MVAIGVTRRRLPARQRGALPPHTTTRVPASPRRGAPPAPPRRCRSGEPDLEGAVVAIGNAPTALFHLLEMLIDGAPRPAAIIGCPVGFIGAAESKEALASSPTTTASTSRSSPSAAAAAARR